MKPEDGLAAGLSTGGFTHGDTGLYRISGEVVVDGARYRLTMRLANDVQRKIEVFRAGGPVLVEPVSERRTAPLAVLGAAGLATVVAAGTVFAVRRRPAA